MDEYKVLENIKYFPDGTIITYEKYSTNYEEEYFFKTIVTTINGEKQQVNVNNLQEIITKDTIDSITNNDGFVIIDYPLNNSKVIKREVIDNSDDYCELSFTVLKEMEKVFSEKNPQFKNIDINKQIDKNDNYWDAHSDILKNILILDDNYNGVVHPEKYDNLINSINDNKPVINIIENEYDYHHNNNTINIVIETTIINNIKIPLFSYQINIEELNSYGLEKIVDNMNAINGNTIFTLDSKKIVLNDKIFNDMLNNRDSIYVSIFDNYFKDIIIVNDFNSNFVKEKRMLSLMKLNSKNHKLPEFDNNVLTIKYLKLNC